LPDAAVSVAKPDTGLTRAAITSTEGRYSAEALLPGIYRVTAEIAGFKRWEQTASVEAGTTTTVNLALEVGERNGGGHRGRCGAGDPS
jgi:hypothetical protein